MSVGYRYRVSVPLRASGASVSTARPGGSVAACGVTGALAGTAAGVAVGAGATAFVPGVDAGVLIAMGLLFGGFNGSLLGLMSRLHAARAS
jgi:hypothetical protein